MVNCRRISKQNRAAKTPRISTSCRRRKHLSIFVVETKLKQDGESPSIFEANATFRIATAYRRRIEVDKYLRRRIEKFFPLGYD